MNLYGIVVGFEKTKDIRTNKYRLLLFTRNGNEYTFNRKVVTGEQLIPELNGNKINFLNIELKQTDKGLDIVGKTGSLERFHNGRNKPFVIISKIETTDGMTVGYKFADYDGHVKNCTSKELLAYCHKITREGGIPLQNAIYRGADNTNINEYIAPYVDNQFFTDLIQRKKPTVKKEEHKEETKTQSLKDIYTKEQLQQLKLAKEHGVNLKLIQNPKLSAEQMKVLRLGAEHGIRGIEKINNPGIGVMSMRVYLEDLKYGIDVAPYVMPGLSPEQIGVISLAYTNGCDLESLLDPSISPLEMEERRLRLENKIFFEYKVNTDKTWNK